ATAVGVLGLLPKNTRAREMAEKALTDEKPEVRSSAAAALGAMHSKASIAKLREAVDDQDPSVALAAAHALIALNDDSGYEVYYEVLTGERKGGKGVIASQTTVLKDQKKLAELGIQEGIGFIPFAGMGWRAFKAIHKNDILAGARGLDKAFRLAVGARGVGAGEALGDAELATGAAKAARAVARSVVGQYPADADAEARVVGHRCPQESRCRCGFLVGQEVGESDAGVIINRHMQIFPALSVNASLAMAGNAAADRGEAPDFLDVEMEQIAGGGLL